MKWLLYIGLFLNIVGTTLVAFSFGKNLYGAYQSDESGRKVYLASFLHPNWFKLGIILLGIGFVLQLIYSIIS